MVRIHHHFGLAVFSCLAVKKNHYQVLYFFKKITKNGGTGKGRKSTIVNILEHENRVFYFNNYSEIDLIQLPKRLCLKLSTTLVYEIVKFIKVLVCEFIAFQLYALMFDLEEGWVPEGDLALNINAIFKENWVPEGGLILDIDTIFKVKINAFKYTLIISCP
ncbi:hypothetical protein C1646_752362 [Rhizophagus diaphanus]|nr:hypothetical protein C1646_752362 [Rhizophagus diaphanus] [Rhizophagus sp. MUCL 43196]